VTQASPINPNLRDKLANEGGYLMIGVDVQVTVGVDSGRECFELGRIVNEFKQQWGRFLRF